VSPPTPAGDLSLPLPAPVAPEEGKPMRSDRGDFFKKAAGAAVVPDQRGTLEVSNLGKSAASC